ncbi:MAG: hypothetical protein QOI32_389, partial [Thermoleophilaceae bacterium]|nr:hypothetical protein [Thermoleophilaceae bacterium]
ANMIDAPKNATRAHSAVFLSTGAHLIRD